MHDKNQSGWSGSPLPIQALVTWHGGERKEAEKMVVSPTWMLYFMENVIKMDDLEVPLFQETFILLGRQW